MPSPSFENKAILVTGAASGIGRAIALAFAGEGAQVAVVDRSTNAGRETVSLIEDAGGAAIYLRADIAQQAAPARMVAETVAAFGRLDAAVNNAGQQGVPAALADGTEANWRRVMDVNLTGVWRCMQAELRHMTKSGGGAIVNIASVAGELAFPGHSPYAASKLGVLGLTRTAAVEYSQHGVRINAVCPGFVQTPMLEKGVRALPQAEAEMKASIPLGRYGEPEEVAAAALWLASEQAGYVVGQTLIVDGGVSLRYQAPQL